MSAIPNSTYSIITPKRIRLSSKQLGLYKRIIAFVNKIDSFSSPKVHLEQYSLPSDLIALILILSADDLIGQNVVDLGCGTGRFTLPIKKFYSNRTLGVDIDLDVLVHLAELRRQNELEIDLLITPIEFLENDKWGRKFQTTFMNPPFGTKRRKLDIVFLKQALRHSNKVISIHKTNSQSRNLIKHTGEKFNKRVNLIATISFPLLPSFSFHRKPKHFVCVDLLRFSE